MLKPFANSAQTIAAILLSGSLAFLLCACSLNAGSTQCKGGQEKIQVSTSGSYIPFDLESWVSSATLICSATFVENSDAMLIEPVDGGSPMPFTDSYFEVNEVIKGDALLEDSAMPNRSVLVVRQKGGETQSVSMSNDDAKSFEAGKQYLLFLYSISNGAEYNTAGNHYYLYGSGENGAWEIANEQLLSDNASDTQISISDIKELAAASSVQAGATTTYEESVNNYLADIEEAYQRGDIPQDAYEATVEKYRKQNEEFATIIEIGK